MSRKAMGLIAALAAVVGLMTFAGSAQAQTPSPGSVSISPASQTVEPGAAATVDVVAVAPTGVAPNTNLGAWDLTIIYDPLVLELDTTNIGTCSTVGSTCAAVGTDGVRVAGFASPAAGLPGTITLATLTFTAIGGDGDQSALNITEPLAQWADGPGNVVTGVVVTDGLVLLQAATPTPTPSPTPLATPTPTPTTAATASPTRTATPAQLPATGGTASDGSGSDMAWVLGFLGLAVLAGGIWAVSRTRRESM